MKNVLSKKKVVQMLMFALQKEVERGTTIVKSLFDYCFNSNEHTHMFMFVTQAFCFFYCTIYGFFGVQSGFI